MRNAAFFAKSASSARRDERAGEAASSNPPRRQLPRGPDSHPAAGRLRLLARAPPVAFRSPRTTQPRVSQEEVVPRLSPFSPCLPGEGRSVLRRPTTPPGWSGFPAANDRPRSAPVGQRRATLGLQELEVRQRGPRFGGKFPARPRLEESSPVGPPPRRLPQPSQASVQRGHPLVATFSNCVPRGPEAGHLNRGRSFQV